MSNRVFKGQQGSPEWLEWRREGVGASEAAVLAGCSKYSTQPQMLADKMGMSPVKDTAGMFWGRRREPAIREKVLEKYKVVAEPVCLVHPTLSFMRASYDLISPDFKWGAEIKTVNGKIYKSLLDGVLPQDHYWQVHHQYAVTPELEELVYCAVHREKGVDLEVYIPIKKDERMIGCCIENAEKFMALLNETKENYGNF